MIQELSIFRLSIALLCTGFVAGCAINDRGLVRVDRYENSFGHYVRTRVWGIDVVTVRSDEGVVVGYSDRAYFFPKSIAGGEVQRNPSMAEVLREPMPRVGGGKCDLNELGTPMVIRTVDVGVAIRLGAARVGMTLGMNANTRVRLHRDGTVILAVQFDSEDSEATRFLFREQEE